MEMVKRYWMHRISFEREIKQVFLDHDGLLLTGWGKLSNDVFLNKVLGKDRSDYDLAYISDFGKQTRNRYCLFMFLIEFKKGDYVIVPGDKDFSVYEIVGERPFSKEHIVESANSAESRREFDFKTGRYFRKGTTDELELGFFWKVKPIELNIPRDGFADNTLRKRLKFQMTDIEMTDIEASIEDALKNKRNNKIIDLRSEIVTSTTSTITDKLINKINDTKLEKVVEWYLQRMGATTTFIPAKRNLSNSQGDVDVVSLFDDLRIVVLVQVKQHTTDVDELAIKQVVNARGHYEAQYPAYTSLLWVLATCNNFTEKAVDDANENNVRLIGGDEFAQMILDVGIKDLNV